MSTTPASGRTEGAQCSWKLDSSTASTCGPGLRRSASRIGNPMLPQATLAIPAARRMACVIWVVVVLPLVPVTTSHLRTGP
ncbi:Uncharacterised protein [Mycobacteroides abscessus subsp. abscessus]|nr:Uncharacterised protein [Mycobacteroides abscessus subsp. abscessus]